MYWVEQVEPQEPGCDTRPSPPLKMLGMLPSRPQGCKQGRGGRAHLAAHA